MGAPLDGDFVGRRGVVDYRPRGNAGQRAGRVQPNDTPVTIKHGWV